MMGRFEDSPVISVPRRLNYFPPISTPATMFQRRKKKSARELYHLSPQNHDLILNNPPVTPWDDPPEFFRTFIGTPDDIKNGGQAGDLKTTWPFLHQIGPKCVFKGMPKRIRNTDEEVCDIYKVPQSRNRARSGFNERFLEPECIGISRNFSSPRLEYFSPCYTEMPNASAKRPISSSNIKDDIDIVRQASLVRKVKAPPPSEARSVKSDDSLNDHDHSGMGQYHLSPPFDGIRNNPQQPRRPIRPGEAKANFDAFKKKHKGPPSGERIVHFEDSKLPEKLLQHGAADPESLENSEMCKLTWQDIVQAPVVGTLISVNDDNNMSGLTHAPKSPTKRVEPKNNGVRVSFRLPKTNENFRSDKADSEKQLGAKISDRDIATWIDDVRKAQSRGREKLLR